MMNESYNNLIKEGKLKPDAAQAKVAARLEQLGQELLVDQPRTLLEKLLGKKSHQSKGLFIYGKVGRGKSMLMDVFYKSLPLREKKRVHFHEFMQGVHAQLHKFRENSGGDKDIISEVATDFAKGLKLLCFDEYEVNDVSNAMILSRLFHKMAELGVVFVFTANKPPEEHYKEGLQRQSYLKFCRYLATKVEYVSLNAERDYRLIKHGDEDNYFTPLGYVATQRLKEKFKSMSAEPLMPIKLNVQGREVALRAAGRIADASFAELCGQPLGDADYIEIAKEFDVLFLEGIPKMDEEMRNEAKRFINLIDILYEHKILLVASADAEAENLYTGSSGASEFKRTVSRLKEMQGWKRRAPEDESD